MHGIYTEYAIGNGGFVLRIVFIHYFRRHSFLKPTGSARAAKLAELKARLLGGDPRALALILTAEERAGGRDAIADFLSASGGAQAMADRALKLR